LFPFSKNKETKEKFLGFLKNQNKSMGRVPISTFFHKPTTISPGIKKETDFSVSFAL
jgi:hypothetical protein